MNGLNASRNAGHRFARKHFLKLWCETCHATDALEVHHRDRNPRNNSRENCQTLCETCHTQLHTAAGDWGRPRPPPKTCAVCQTLFQPKSHAARAKLCGSAECAAETGRRTAARRWNK